MLTGAAESTDQSAQVDICIYTDPKMQESDLPSGRHSIESAEPISESVQSHSALSPDVEHHNKSQWLIEVSRGSRTKYRVTVESQCRILSCNAEKKKYTQPQTFGEMHGQFAPKRRDLDTDTDNMIRTYLYYKSAYKCCVTTWILSTFQRGPVSTYTTSSSSILFHFVSLFFSFFFFLFFVFMFQQLMFTSHNRTQARRVSCREKNNSSS